MSGDLRTYVDTLFDNFGPQQWWPAETPFEVMVGAVLTQNTAWRNVEKAIKNLSSSNLLDPRTMLALPDARLEELIRPSGFYRQKTRRLKELLRWFVGQYGGAVENMRSVESESLREELLALWGIGPETADAILLYAVGHPVFVVDAYTTRVISRHGLLPGDSTYDEIQQYAHEQLPQDAGYLNEAHALFVEVGKRHCHARKPDCAQCPLCVYLMQR